MKPFTVALEWNEPFARWFGDGELNASVNCSRPPRARRAAAIASPSTSKASPAIAARSTYRELLEDVCRFANGLRTLGIKKGDRVAIYMPMIPELPVAMLACARIGAAHSVIFGGFSPDSIVDRVNDAECVALITADYGWRRGKRCRSSATATMRCERTPSIRHCVVASRVGDDVDMHAGRDHWWSDDRRRPARDVRARAR